MHLSCKRHSERFAKIVSGKNTRKSAVLREEIMMKLLCRCAALALLLVATGSHSRALAQDFPSRNLTIIVPLGTGTGMDVVVRLYAEKLAAALGKAVIVENTPRA